MRALTLWRPWPWAILHGKNVENRPWKPPASIIGKRIALHAGKTWDDSSLTLIRKVLPSVPGSSADHPLGIVGVARVVGYMHPEGDGRRVLNTGSEFEFDDRWFFGPYGWLLDQITAIDPVPCRGAQGLWPVPEHVERIVIQRCEAGRDMVPDHRARCAAILDDVHVRLFLPWPVRSELQKYRELDQLNPLQIGLLEKAEARVREVRS